MGGRGGASPTLSREPRRGGRTGWHDTPGAAATPGPGAAPVDRGRAADLPAAPARPDAPRAPAPQPDHRQGGGDPLHADRLPPAAHHPPGPAAGGAAGPAAAQELPGPGRDLHEVRPDHRLVARHVRRRRGRRVPGLPRHRARRCRSPTCASGWRRTSACRCATRSPNSSPTRSARPPSPSCTGPASSTGARWRSRCCDPTSSTWWRPTSTSCSRCSRSWCARPATRWPAPRCSCSTASGCRSARRWTCATRRARSSTSAGCRTSST